MAYSLIDDKIPYEPDPSFSMVDIVIQTICLCFDPNQDDNVQLQIIKGLNTAIASCTVRGKALQLAVKTCFIIHLVSKNIINQKTALSTVTQILAFVFQNLEKHANDDEEIVDDDEDVQESEVDSFSSTVSATGSIAKETTTTKEPTGLVRSNSNSSLGSSNSYDVNVLNGAVAITTESDRPFTPVTDDGKAQDSIAIFVGDIIDDNPVHSNDKKPSTVANKEHHYRQDAYLVLKELCRLSIKKLPPVSNLENSIQMRTRIVAMQLIHDILENSGPGFRGSKSFMREIQKHLCMTILVNGLATHPAIFDQAIGVLKLLIQHFKVHLKVKFSLQNSHLLVGNWCILDRCISQNSQ
jgi:brefeldin A-inhibited guanine nucleotide-exchange protein